MLRQVSVNVGRQTLFLYNINDPDNPIELAFQQRYGMIISYKWSVPPRVACHSVAGCGRSSTLLLLV